MWRPFQEDEVPIHDSNHNNKNEMNKKHHQQNSKNITKQIMRNPLIGLRQLLQDKHTQYFPTFNPANVQKDRCYAGYGIYGLYIRTARDQYNFGQVVEKVEKVFLGSKRQIGKLVMRYFGSNQEEFETKRKQYFKQLDLMEQGFLTLIKADDINQITNAIIMLNRKPETHDKTNIANLQTILKKIQNYCQHNAEHLQLNNDELQTMKNNFDSFLKKKITENQKKRGKKARKGFQGQAEEDGDQMEEENGKGKGKGIRKGKGKKKVERISFEKYCKDLEDEML